MRLCVIFSNKNLKFEQDAYFLFDLLWYEIKMVQRTRLANLTELTILQCHTRIQEENIIQL